MSKQPIQMVDLKAQYQELKTEIDHNIQSVIDSCAFIKGPMVSEFERKLANYLNINTVVACGNGTDALQIALMALDLAPGDEVIVPSFTYVATAEVIALLGLKPVMVDVDYNSFNIEAETIKKHITPKTKAIVPVHLFGQISPMESIMDLARENNLFVIEDNAQSIGATYTFSDNRTAKSGCLGHISCTSFYPSKNLGAYGDGGAIMTDDEKLGEKIRKIANHGQSKRYYHSHVGVNSRLDSIQAAILTVKLDHLDSFNHKRKELAKYYRLKLNAISDISLPEELHYSDHVYHQFTMKVLNGKRSELQEFLKSNDIPTMIYYPVPLYDQEAYSVCHNGLKHTNTERLCKEVVSLPMHPNMSLAQAQHITETIISFFN